MAELIRHHDSKLVDILRDELQEFVAVPLQEEYLQNTLNALMTYIRSDARSSKNTIIVDSVSYWDKTEKTFYYKNKSIKLTPKERTLFALLFKNIRIGTSYDMISVELWGDSAIGNQERIKTIVKQLRKKLPKNIIKNIFSYGYKIEIS